MALVCFNITYVRVVSLTKTKLLVRDEFTGTLPDGRREVFSREARSSCSMGMQ